MACEGLRKGEAFGDSGVEDLGKMFGWVGRVDMRQRVRDRGRDMMVEMLGHEVVAEAAWAVAAAWS